MEDKEPGLTVCPFPTVPLQMLTEQARDSIDDFDPKTFAKWNRNSKEPLEADIFPLSLRSYQQNALEDWAKNDYRGVLKHATGAGKTVTALKAIFDNAKVGKSALVLASMLLSNGLIKETFKKCELPVWGGTMNGRLSV